MSGARPEIGAQRPYFHAVRGLYALLVMGGATLAFTGCSVRHEPPGDGITSVRGTRPASTSALPSPATLIPRGTATPPVQISPAGMDALRKGVSLLQQGRLTDAAHVFAKAVATDPRATLTHDYLGIAYLKLGRTDAALKQFREEVRIDPNGMTGWARIGDVYFYRNDIKAAIKAVERAVALQPNVAQLYFNLGNLYPRELELGKGVDALGRCIALEPNNHQAHFMRGQLLYEMARMDEAEQEMDTAIRIEPHVGLYHLALAKLYLHRDGTRRQAERAQAEIQTALSLGLEQPAEAHYQLGVCYQREEQWEPARREFETSVQTAPEAWSAYYALGQVLDKLGRYDEARKARAQFTALRAREDQHRKREFYTQQVERNMESAEAHFQLAQFLMRRGDLRGAASAVATARRLAGVTQGSAELRGRIAALSAKLQRARGN